MKIFRLLFYPNQNSGVWEFVGKLLNYPISLPNLNHPLHRPRGADADVLGDFEHVAVELHVHFPITTTTACSRSKAICDSQRCDVSQPSLLSKSPFPSVETGICSWSCSAYSIRWQVWWA